MGGTYVIRSSASQEVGHQGSCLSNPLLITGLCLKGSDHLGVLVIVGGVVPGYGRDRACMCPAISTIDSSKITLGVHTRSRLTIAIGMMSLLAHHLGNVYAVGQASALGHARARRGWDALECVFPLGIGRHFVQRGTGLVVWQIGLSRVREQRQDSCDPLRRASLAGRDH